MYSTRRSLEKVKELRCDQLQTRVCESSAEFGSARVLRKLTMLGVRGDPLFSNFGKMPKGAVPHRRRSKLYLCRRLGEQNPFYEVSAHLLRGGRGTLANFLQPDMLEARSVAGMIRMFLLSRWRSARYG